MDSKSHTIRSNTKAPSSGVVSGWETISTLENDAKNTDRTIMKSSIILKIVSIANS